MAKTAKKEVKEIKKEILKKADLVANIATAGAISKAEAERELNNVLAGMETTVKDMKNGGKLQLVGYMTMEVKDKKETTAHNPKTGEEVIVPAHKVLRIKAGKTLLAPIE
jgi:DNA-binding protein HU-beta